MNKNNLIKLGALAQERFLMKENFSIMEVASDAPRSVRVAIPDSLPFNSDGPYGMALHFDTVELVKIASRDNSEFAWCGYSDAANVLVFREAG